MTRGRDSIVIVINSYRNIVHLRTSEKANTKDNADIGVIASS